MGAVRGKQGDIVALLTQKFEYRITQDILGKKVKEIRQELSSKDANDNNCLHYTYLLN